MGRAVLISIQPKWCELIASGKKTVEVRKNKPKLETPFKVYIYCTQGDALNYLISIRQQSFEKYWIDNEAFGANVGRANGKVIGEFICDKIYDIKPHYDIPIFCNQYEYGWKIGEAEDCLSFDELDFYLGGKRGYGWHISDLKIYNKPKNKVEFCHPCDRDPQCDCRYCVRYAGNKPILRAPQSWCYVEQLQNEYSGGHHE